MTGIFAQGRNQGSLGRIYGNEEYIIFRAKKKYPVHERDQGVEEAVKDGISKNAPDHSKLRIQSKNCMERIRQYLEGLSADDPASK